ncbi:hypothetical protein [Rhodococcus koreensis]|uniref:hypothetical protein n=1 Tax=Rhodococcus koreensis TaxID=99653 RepID=UPI00197FCBF0|nr:hypothetical protein [Rhodococcus koreensis]QSE86928.1 hypothetical protein JWS14_48875 [Rhodococcus koreensis]
MSDRTGHDEPAPRSTGSSRVGADSQAELPPRSSLPAASRGASLQGMTIIGRTLVHMSGWCWVLTGAHAALESAPTLRRRVDPERVVVGAGLLGCDAAGALPAQAPIPGQRLLVVEFADGKIILTRIVPSQMVVAESFVHRINHTGPHQSPP